MGKVMQTRRKLAHFFNWRCSITLTDGRVLVGVLMAVDKHVNLVLCNTEEYRRYKVKGRPEGKELKRTLGFVIIRGTGVLYVTPEELGKEDLVEPVKPRKQKAKAAGAPPSAAAALPKPAMPGGMPGMPGMPGLPGGLPGMPGMNPLAGLMARPGMPGMPGMMPGMPRPMMPGMMPGGMPGGMPGMPAGLPAGINPAMLLGKGGGGMPAGMMAMYRPP
eukprot:gnl/TRDRNA2_/TRDRNA2_173887_c0_seq1.p1 gnl/TRDRNA2_/TRDRNA2_173887_c0~~gnl/TRDRNA2_/TRDRNA2_173887_c0_seq1.p1  ORF type:complete len:218 (+),score=45.16 gnl/TRDRNA2_/TRDRNA2_173887_c0_seq1:82-735(+)